jgi:hypothetical protein
MIALGHTGAGALVGLLGLSIHQADILPLWALFMMTLVAAIGSHYVGDWLPHGHYPFNLKQDRQGSIIRLGLDLGIGFGLLIIAAWSAYGFGVELSLILLGAIGANVPDIFENLVNLKLLPNGQRTREHRAWHAKRLHWHNDPNSPLPGGARVLTWVDLYQSAFIVAALWWILR